MSFRVSGFRYRKLEIADTQNNVNKISILQFAIFDNWNLEIGNWQLVYSVFLLEIGLVFKYKYFLELNNTENHFHYIQILTAL